MLNFIKSNLLNKETSAELAKCKSIQMMLNQFNDEVLDKGKVEDTEKVKFLKLYNQFITLRSDLEFYEESDYFGRHRQFNHEIDWGILNAADKEIKRMMRNKSWDWEFVEGCIEDAEVEIELLEKYSYDESYLPEELL